MEGIIKRDKEAVVHIGSVAMAGIFFNFEYQIPAPKFWK